MRLTIAVFFTLAMAGCAHSSVPNDTLTDTFTGSVSGVVVLPDSAGSNADCTQVAVFATTPDEKGGALRVGRPSVHSGHGRCSYEISNLPADVALSIHVEPTAGLTCGNGAPVAFASQNQEPLSLKENTSVMRDFRAQCNATTSSLQGCSGADGAHRLDLKPKG
jgi:hypothetical protein